MNKTLYLIIAFLFLSLTAYPQGNNAVNITIIGSGSYSSKLADFYSISNEGMLTVMLRNQDFKEAVIPVQLYMSVTNLGDTYILTKSPNPTQPINLNSGETVALTGTDLSRLFNTAYLTYKGTNLRDGTNVLKIYARDTRTGKVVSNTASITLRSVVIAPPKLVAPDNGIVIETDNPFYLFRWQGDNGGSYKAANYNYVYRFELWKQNNTDPSVEAQRTPDFTIDNIKTEQYQMLLTQYPFEIGQKYCWRVKAEDPAKRTTFINEGKSEVRSFTYKHLPVPVTGLTHRIKETTRRATVTWNATEGHTKYYVEYFNPQTNKTISETTDVPKYELAAAPDSEYKILFRVKAQCWGDDNRISDWTRWDTIHYAARKPVTSEYECGHKFPHVDITNFTLKTNFEEGDIVREANGSSDYEIINYAVDADSTLRGQFYLVMNAWGGAKIACEFWDTKINTDNVVITTRYRSLDLPGYVVDPDEIQRYVKGLWLDANSVATSSKIRDTIVIKEKFDYLYAADDGTLYAVVVNPNGTVTETKVSTNKSTSQCLVTDGKGDSLVISKNGQPMGIQEYRATGGNKALLKEYHRKSDSLAKWQINFSKYDAQTYAFDRLGSGDHGIFATDEYYPKSGSYDFRYKSVECGKTDRIVVDFGSYSEKDSVIFKDKYGVTLKVVDKNILTFTGVSNADTNFIYAYRGDKKIGKLFLNTYQRKTYKVVLVSVNDATLPNTSTLADYLNKVYRQCVDSFEITTDKIKIDDLKSFSHGGSGVLTVYNDDQKKVLKAYDSKMQDNTYYLFFVDGVTDKKDGSGTLVSGYMPRGYNCGFIYDGGSERTIAHELGHGIAGLEHVFADSKASGNTQNLMDYATGTALWHFQWDQIQDPSRVWMKWNKAEGEGENQGEPEPTERNLFWYKISEQPISGIFLAPSRLPIWINDVQYVYVLKSSYYGITVTNENNQRPDDAIYGFKTSNDKTFIAHFSNSGEFGGFYNDDILYIDQEQKTFTNYGMYGNPIRYWNITAGKLDDTYNQFIAHKLPKGDAWNNYCAVVNSIYDYISKLDLPDKAIWHPLENQISGIFIAPSKLPIWIDNVTQIYVLNSFGTGISLEQSPSEAIYGFKTSGGDSFVAQFSLSGKFEGFYNGDTRYVDENKKTLTNFGFIEGTIHSWDPKGELITLPREQGYSLPKTTNGAFDNYSAIVNESDYYEVYLGKLGQPISGMFLAPSNMPIWIDNVTDVYLSKPQNAIYGFKTANNETYFAKFSSNEFNGFYNIGTNKLYVDKNTFTLKAYGETGYPIYYWDNTISEINNTDNKFVKHKLPIGASKFNYCAVFDKDDYFEAQTAELMRCYTLYLHYKEKHPALFESHVFHTSIENNPCLLEGLESFKVVKNKSKFMDGLNRMVNAGLAVAAIPIAIPICVEAIAATGSTLPKFLQDKAIDFTIAFSTDLACSYIINTVSYCLEHNYESETHYGGLPAIMVQVWKKNWKEMLLDASMEGGKALIPAMSNSKRIVINAVINGAEAIEFVKIWKTISGTATTPDELTNFKEQTLNFMIGVSFSSISDVLSRHIAKVKFNNNQFIGILRQTLKQLKIKDDDIADLVFEAAKKYNHPIFKNLTKNDEKIVKRLLLNDQGANILDHASQCDISYCRNLLKRNYSDLKDKDIADFLFNTTKVCDNPIFNKLTMTDNQYVKTLLTTEEGTKLLDYAIKSEISDMSIVKFLDYCKVSFPTSMRKMTPEIINKLNYILKDLNQTDLNYVRNIINRSISPEDVISDLFETLKVFEKEDVKTKWIKQYWDYIRFESFKFHYQGHTYSYTMTPTLSDVRTTILKKRKFIEDKFKAFHAIDKNGNPCWCLYLQSERLFFVPIKDEVSNCYQWIEKNSTVVSNFIRGEYVKPYSHLTGNNNENNE